MLILVFSAFGCVNIKYSDLLVLLDRRPKGSSVFWIDSRKFCCIVERSGAGLSHLRIFDCRCEVAHAKDEVTDVKLLRPMRLAASAEVWAQVRCRACEVVVRTYEDMP